MGPKVASSSAAASQQQQQQQQQQQRSARAGAGDAVDLNTLPAQTLLQVKKQLDDELEHLNASFNSLRGASQKFADCLVSLRAGVASLAPGAPLLVPLTTSLYVPGELADSGRVLVDVGTGFYVEKGVDGARAFYERKIKELDGNLKGLEEVLKGKSQNLRVVEDVLRQKVAQSQQQQQPQSAGTASAAA